MSLRGVLHATGSSDYLVAFSVIDPDFDDEWNDRALLQHEVDVSGAVSLHPDENRREFDPVPLFGTRDHSGISELQRRVGERQQRVQRRRNTDRRVLHTWFATPEPEPPPSEWGISLALHHDLMLGMEIGKPLVRGQARVWKGHVMVRADDLANWRVDPVRAAYPEIWRGYGFVIFEIE
jgi:hypothetical protein